MLLQTESGSFVRTVSAFGFWTTSSALSHIFSGYSSVAGHQVKHKVKGKHCRQQVSANPAASQGGPPGTSGLSGCADWYEWQEVGAGVLEGGRAGLELLLSVCVWLAELTDICSR